MPPSGALLAGFASKDPFALKVRGLPQKSNPLMATRTPRGLDGASAPSMLAMSLASQRGAPPGNRTLVRFFSSH